MEKNLNVDATDQELMDAGFKRKAHDIDGYDYSFSKEIINELILCIHIQRESCYGHLYYKGNILKSLKPTKEAINAEFKHFGQPLPQWEKPKPKVGEVWGNERNTLVITPTDINYTGIDIFYIYNSSGHDLLAGSYMSFRVMEDFGYKKLADTLDDYYKEKFTKNNPLSELDKQIEELDDRLKQQTVIDTIEEMNKEIFKPTTIDPKSQVEKAHQKT